MNNNSNKNTERKMSIDRTVNVHVQLFTDVQYRGVLCVVQVGYGLGEKLFLCLAVLVLSDL